MAMTTGAATTTNILSDQLAIDLGDSINLLEPSAQPLAVFSRKAEKKRTVATKYSWLEDAVQGQVRGAVGRRDERRDVGRGVGRAGRAVPAVGSGAQHPHGRAVPRGRGRDGHPHGDAGDRVDGTAMLNGDELYIIGTAQPENDTSKPSRFDVPSKVTNNTQIFRTPFEISGSLEASGFQASPAEWPRQARNKGIEHAKDIELTFLLGRKSATTPGATEDRTTGGVLSFITSNQTDAGGDLSEAEFNAFMLQVMRYGSGSKLAIASGVGVSALNKFPASKQQTATTRRRTA
jgi:hypothetical protein